MWIKIVKVIVFIMLLLAVAIWVTFVATEGHYVLVRHFATPGGTPDLNSALKSDNHYEREAAAHRLANLGPQSAGAAQAAEASFEQDKYSRGHWYITYAATQMGDAGVDLLAQAIVQGGETSELAKKSFQKLPPDRQVKTMLAVVAKNKDNKDKEIVRRALNWIGGLGTNADAKVDDGFFEQHPVYRPAMDDKTAAEAATALIPLLIDNYDYFTSAKNTLIFLGAPAARPIGEALAKHPSPNFDWRDRNRLYAVLKGLGPLGKPAAPELIQAIGTETDLLSIRDALEALAAIQPDPTPAAAALRRAAEVWKVKKPDSDYVQGYFEVALEKIGDEQTQKQLIEDLKLPSGNDRSWRAAQALCDLGPRAKTALPDLEAALESTWSILRVEAAAAIVNISGPDTPLGQRALHALDEALGNERSNVRGMATIYLGKIGPPAKLATPQLIALLKNTKVDYKDRMLMIDSLEKIDPTDKQVAAALKTALESDPSPEVQNFAIHAYKKSNDALPSIPLADAIARLKEKDTKPLDLWQAQQTIKQSGAAAAAPLAELINIDPRYEAWDFARDQLVALGPKAAPAVPVLATAVATGPAKSVRPALLTLAALGDVAQGAVPVLMPIATGPYTDSTFETIRTIQAIDPDAYVQSQKSSGDLWITFGGAVLPLLLIVWIVRWFRRPRASTSIPVAQA